MDAETGSLQTASRTSPSVGKSEASWRKPRPALAVAWVRFGSFRANAQPTNQFATVDQAAALALFLCRDEASAVTGANPSMYGGWSAQYAAPSGSRRDGVRRPARRGLLADRLCQSKCTSR